MTASLLMNELKSVRDGVILDVREPEECQYGMIPDAINIPMQEIPYRLATLSKDQTYYIVCQSGSRSAVVSQYMAQAGYKTVNLMGGMAAYKGRLNYEMQQ